MEIEHAEGINILLIGFIVVIAATTWLSRWSWSITPTMSASRAIRRTDENRHDSRITSLTWTDVWILMHREYPYISPLMISIAIVIETIAMMWFSLHGLRYRDLSMIGPRSTTPDLVDRVRRVWTNACRYRGQSASEWIDTAIFFGMIPQPVWLLALIDRRLARWSRRSPMPTC